MCSLLLWLFLLFYSTFPCDIYFYQLLLTLIQFIHKQFLKYCVLLEHEIYFNHAKNDTFPNVSILVGHLSSQHIWKTHYVLNYFLNLFLTQGLKLLLWNVLKLILNHPHERLQPWRLLCSQQWLYRLWYEINITRNNQLLQQILSHLIGDALMLWSDIRWIGFQSSDQNVITISFKTWGSVASSWPTTVWLFYYVS